MIRGLFILISVWVLLLGSACRSPEALPPPEPVAQLHVQPQLPRRGLPVSDFERLAHWEVSSLSGAVELKKELSQVLWGRASAQISFNPLLPGPRSVTLVPAEPWEIQSQFDTVLLWIRHDEKAGLRNDCRIRLQYRDAHGKSGEWVLPYSPASEMQMLHHCIREKIPTPVQVESLVWDLPATLDGTQNLYLDSLSIYQEVLSSIPQTVYYVRPFGYAPVFAPKRKNSVTLNFPTGPNAFRPQTQSGKTVTSLERDGESGYVFHFESKEIKLDYQIQPQPGMPAVAVRVNGKAYPSLWQEAGVMTEEGAPELRFARMNGDRLMFQYTQGLQFEFSLHGKTLQVDMNSLLENVKEFNLGEISRGNQTLPQVLTLPLFRIQENQRWPVFAFTEQDKTFLVSCFPDWWSSLSSRYEPAMEARDPYNIALGKMRYEPQWRGTRTMFRERIYFTVSDQLQEVLPSPAMPQSMYRLDSGFGKGGAPGISPPLHLMSIRPLDEAWQDRLLARSPQGDWREHPVEGYLIKSGLFVGTPLEKLLDFRLKHADEVLNVPALGKYPPWRYLDYDVRSVGGASFTQTLAEAGALLQQVEAEWGGPVLSEGGAEWFWSGLLSVLVPTFPLGLQELHPLLPHFAWYNVHPFSQIFGLGALHDFRLPSEAGVTEEVLLDRLLAVQVAYAAVGKLPDVESADLKNKAQRIQTLLQQHFSSAKIERIAYWSGDKFLDAGEAVAANVLQDSRLYLRLDSFTEIWVNGDLFDSWSVRVDGRELELPPFGFVVRGNDLLVVNLPGQDGEPGRTLLKGPGQTWVSSPGVELEELSMRLKGSLQVLELADGEYKLDMDDWQGEAWISNEVLTIEQVGTLRGITEDGRPVNDLILVRQGEGWLLKSDAAVHRVWVSPEISGSDLKFSP
ncbi:hypothetical protein P0Y35_00765 [Kiritimatiellaeota bacterium B1221]|nr:hypothetical protein [Kiritimatiellaeota bacterium B1221]